MAGRPAAKDKLRTLEEAKEYYLKIIAVISDIESGESERVSCAKHGITIVSFRNDTLYKKKFGCNDKYSAARLYLSPYERIYEDVLDEKLDFISIFTVPVDIDETLEAIMQEYLTERERQVLKMYYFESNTFTEIGNFMKLSISRIAQLQHGALRKLRRNIYRIEVGDSFIDEVSQKRQDYRLQKLEEAQKQCEAEINSEVSSLNVAHENKVSSYSAMCEPIELLDISTRAYTALKMRKLSTISQVKEYVDSGKLRSLRNVGKATEANIVQALKTYIDEHS